MSASGGGGGGAGLVIRAPLTADDRDSPSPTASDYDSFATASDLDDYDYGFAPAGGPVSPLAAVPLAKLTRDEDDVVGTDDDVVDASEEDGWVSDSPPRSPVARVVSLDREAGKAPVNIVKGSQVEMAVEKRGEVSEKLDSELSSSVNQFLEHGLAVHNSRIEMLDNPLHGAMEPAASELFESVPSTARSVSDVGTDYYETKDTTSEFDSVSSIDADGVVNRWVDSTDFYDAKYSDFDSANLVDYGVKRALEMESAEAESNEIGLQLPISLNEKQLGDELQDNSRYYTDKTLTLGVNSDDQVEYQNIVHRMEISGAKTSDVAVLANALQCASNALDIKHGNTLSDIGDSTVKGFTPVGLGYTGVSLKPSPLSHVSTPKSDTSQPFVPLKLKSDMSEAELKAIKYLRVVNRLGHTFEHPVAVQVVNCLCQAEGSWRSNQLGLLSDRKIAWEKAVQIDADKDNQLDFSCNVLVLGETGVGKSATINSIFGEEKSKVSAFESETRSVREFVGSVNGVRLRVLDTPGLRASALDHHYNCKVLLSIRKYMKRCPPDVVLYVDRFDSQQNGYKDQYILKLISSTLGSSIWSTAIVVLTHAAAAPPEGPSGLLLNYETAVNRRLLAIQKAILRVSENRMFNNPLALVENHHSCRKNRQGERVLPNGVEWKTDLLLRCYSLKVLSQTKVGSHRLQSGNMSHVWFSSPLLSYFLNSLLQSKEHPKLHGEHLVENGGGDADLDDQMCENKDGEELVLGQIPPFNPLKEEIDPLSMEQQRNYFDRLRLYQKKKLKEELGQLGEIKYNNNKNDDSNEHCHKHNNLDEDDGPEPHSFQLLELPLQPSFDSGTPNYCYRGLISTSQFQVKSFVDPNGWDHDCGYDTVLLEKRCAVARCYPAVGCLQVLKDKSRFALHLDSSISAKHGKAFSVLGNLDLETIENEFASTLRGEARFQSFKNNRITGQMSITSLKGAKLYGLKLEDKLSFGNILTALFTVGSIYTKFATVHGTRLEVHPQDDNPISEVLKTLGLTIFQCNNDLACMGNVLSQFPIGKKNIAVNVMLSNMLEGQISMKISSSEHIYYSTLCAVPILLRLLKDLCGLKSD